jgi:hypothetical protein
MANRISNLIARLCKPHMSELGKELLPLVYEGEWKLDEYRITHKDAGVSFWVANGFSRFRLYDIKGLPYHDESYRDALNFADKWVLWTCYQNLLDRISLKPAEAALNMVRMHNMKGEVK